MSNIVPFDAGLPAYLKQAAIDVNADITQHASTGFPVISLKGKQFAVVRDGERKVLPNPKDPDSPATSIDVVIIKASKVKAKVWYAKGYDPKESDGKKPDCFSNDGAKPDPSSELPQSKLCVTCPRNVWGAKSTDGRKGKECADSVRIAVATPNLLNDPYLLRVPAASIKPLGEFGTQMSKRNVPYTAVVTKIGFDPEAESPKLTFRAIGFLDEATHKQAVAESKGEVVAAILGTVSEAEAIADAPTAEAVIAKAAAPIPLSKSKTVTDDEIEAAVAKAETEVAPKPAKAAKAAPAEVDVDIKDLNLDDVNFDD